MLLKEVFAHSWESLQRNRLRSVLTMLGIVWGLATVVLLLGYGQSVGESKQANAKLSTVERDLDTTGQVAGIPNSSFSSPKELGAVLAGSPQCQECIVKQYFRFVAGRTETPADRPLIRRAFRDFKESGFRFKEMIVSIVSAPEFRGEGGPPHVAGDH